MTERQTVYWDYSDRRKNFILSYSEYSNQIQFRQMTNVCVCGGVLFSYKEEFNGRHAFVPDTNLETIRDGGHVFRTLLLQVECLDLKPRLSYMKCKGQECVGSVGWGSLGSFGADMMAEGLGKAARVWRHEQSVS